MFWYFDVSTRPGEKIAAFQGCAKMVCFQLTWYRGVWGCLFESLGVRWHMTAWCSLYNKRGHLGIPEGVFRDKTICFDDQMCSEVYLRAQPMLYRVRVEPTQNFDKTLLGGIFFTWLFWDIKISKPSLNSLEQIYWTRLFLDALASLRSILFSD